MVTYTNTEQYVVDECDRANKYQHTKDIDTDCLQDKVHAWTHRDRARLYLFENFFLYWGWDIHMLLQIGIVFLESLFGSLDAYTHGSER